jgi:hypothetical protein
MELGIDPVSWQFRKYLCQGCIPTRKEVKNRRISEEAQMKTTPPSLHERTHEQLTGQINSAVAC